MTCYLVTESQNDAVVLADLVVPLFGSGSVRVVAGDGASAAMSLARTLLVSKPARVGLIVDADGRDEERALQRRSDASALLRSVASPGQSRLFLAIPQFESLFFYDSHWVERRRGAPLNNEEAALARERPRQLLIQLLNPTGRSLHPGDLRTLVQEIGADTLRKAPLVREIVEFVRQPATLHAVF